MSASSSSSPPPTAAKAVVGYDRDEDDDDDDDDDDDNDDVVGGGGNDAANNATEDEEVYHSELERDADDNDNDDDDDDDDDDEDNGMVSITRHRRRRTDNRNRRHNATTTTTTLSSSSASTVAALSAAVQTVSTIGEGVRHAASHWRILLFGQAMSLLLAGTGAASATLQFECRLSAPAFQTMFVYVGLALHVVNLLRNRGARGRGDGNDGNNGGRGDMAGGIRRGRHERQRHRFLGTWIGRKFVDGLDDEAAATRKQNKIRTGGSRFQPKGGNRRADDDKGKGGGIGGEKRIDDTTDRDHDADMVKAYKDAARAVAEITDGIYDDDDDDDIRSAASDEAAAHDSNIDATSALRHRNIATDHDDDDAYNDNAEAAAAAAIVLPPAHSCLCGLVPLHAPAWAYLLLAFLDVEANYLTYLAFRYTTFASISLFDALAIPSAMVFSRAILKREYRRAHLFGATVCMMGVAVNVLADYKEEQRRASDDSAAGGEERGLDNDHSDEYPYRVYGDMLAITGGMLYGLNDVLSETAVRNWGGQEELLSMLGLYGTLVSIAQVALFEMKDVARFFNVGSMAQHMANVQSAFDDDTVGDDVERTIANDEEEELEMEMEMGRWHCSTQFSFLLLSVYAVSNYFAYVGTVKFLCVSEAALLNLSLLTGDLWAVLFSVIAEKIFPLPLFYVALALIVLGVVIYEIGPSPIVDDDEEEEERRHYGKEIRIRTRKGGDGESRTRTRFRARRRLFKLGRGSAPDQDDPGLTWGYDNDDDYDDVDGYEEGEGEGEGGVEFGQSEEGLDLTEHAVGGTRVGGGASGRVKRGKTLRPKGLGFV